MADYFSYLYVPAPKTIYREVRKLQAAHYLVVDESGIREVPYWDIRFDQPRELSESQWCDTFLDEYRTAVKSRLVSDVPLGAFLSGGVDSSSVVALMNETQSPVTTCSIGFSEQSYDEAHDAKKFAGSLNANHFELIVKPKAIDLLQKLAWHYDEPFADSSAVPTYYVSQVARQHVTVALSGDGGDENFAGYGRYRHEQWENRLRSVLPAPVRRSIFGPLGSVYPKLGWAPRMFRAKSIFQSLARPIEGISITGRFPPPGSNAGC
jgi:asparagine synthase (glutamine-hydrolysing)